MLERRQHVRVRVRLSGKYALSEGPSPSVQGRILGIVEAGEIENLSTGGVLLSTSRQLPLGTTVRLDIETEEEPPQVWGRVVWVAEGKIGIEIVDVTEQAKRRIEQLVERALCGEGSA